MFGPPSARRRKAAGKCAVVKKLKEVQESSPGTRMSAERRSFRPDVQLVSVLPAQRGVGGGEVLHHPPQRRIRRRSDRAAGARKPRDRPHLRGGGAVGAGAGLRQARAGVPHAGPGPGALHAA